MVKETYCLNAESKSEVESKITITFDPLGVFTASKENEFSDEEQEPAWNFRLWGSSVQLSRHLEVLLKDSSITPDCLIELGSGK